MTHELAELAEKLVSNSEALRDRLGKDGIETVIRDQWTDGEDIECLSIVGVTASGKAFHSRPAAVSSFTDLLAATMKETAATILQERENAAATRARLGLK